MANERRRNSLIRLEIRLVDVFSAVQRSCFVVKMKNNIVVA